MVESFHQSEANIFSGQLITVWGNLLCLLYDECSTSSLSLSKTSDYTALATRFFMSDQ